MILQGAWQCLDMALGRGSLCSKFCGRYPCDGAVGKWSGACLAAQIHGASDGGNALWWLASAAARRAEVLLNWKGLGSSWLSCRNGYGWIPINTIFRGDEHPFTSYFDVHQGYKVLTHCQMLTSLLNYECVGSVGTAKTRFWTAHHRSWCAHIMFLQCWAAAGRQFVDWILSPRCCMESPTTTILGDHRRILVLGYQSLIPNDYQYGFTWQGWYALIQPRTESFGSLENLVPWATWTHICHHGFLFELVPAVCDRRRMQLGV